MPRDKNRRLNRVKLDCPRCHQPQLARIARQGFLRNRIYPLFGLYPWQCAICGKQRLIRKRSAGYWQPSSRSPVARPVSSQSDTQQAH